MTIKGITIVSLILTLTGCLSTNNQLTTEQQALLGNVINNFKINPAQQLVTQKPEQKPKEYITEEQLNQQMLAVNETGGPALFHRKKGGVSINGQLFNDFEGSVSNLGADRLTGNFTYTIKNFNGTHTLKYHRANSQSTPIVIATVNKQKDSFRVETVTGKVTTGNNVIPTSDGFIIGRPGAAFRYTIGQNKIESINIIDGYHIAQHQNGDVASTGYILLEKNARKSSDQIGGLFDSISSLGNTFGINKVDDYVLMNINTAAIVPLDVSLSGKNVAVHSNCKSKGIYNECDDVSFTEALYDKSGFKNNSHYFWSIDWVNTPQGPLAFYKTATTVKVVDIKKKKVHTLFTRILGVNEFVLIEHLDGKVSVKALLGFSTETKEDIESIITTNLASAEDMQTL